MAEPAKLSQQTYGNFIDGEFRPASDGATLVSENPATGEKLADIADATREDVDAAAAAGRAAFDAWSATAVQERAKVLWRIADVIEENLDYLAAVETMDNGKPIRETTAADVPLAVDHFRYFSGVIRGEEGSATVVKPNLMNMILREPLGTVGQIVPWNFPFLMGAWKLAPALAAGNTIVFKPSSSTSLSILELARLIQEADILPPGVLNVVTGSGRKAGTYVQEADLDKLAFTGSTEVGRDIAVAAAKKLIPATLELGGKSANIFFEDTDMDMALEGVQMGILFNQGQVCSAGSRILVQKSFYDEFLSRITDAFKTVRVGNPLDPETQMGAQVNEKQLTDILDYVDIGKEEGASVAAGGKRAEGGELDQGAFLEPTLLADVDNSMRVAQEEIFGPVGVVIPFTDEDDAVSVANDSIYGLGGGVFTTDIGKGLRVARKVRTGRVWVNTYNQFPAGAPFGGYKQSGIGRETHKAILDAYSQTKNILVNMNDQPAGMYVEG